jgi:endonuclease I
MVAAIKYSRPHFKFVTFWHANDPVSAREIERNNAIYARQSNRNPFIDNHLM